MASARSNTENGPDDPFAADLPGVAHSPDRAVGVLGEKEAAIFHDCDSHRSTPNISIGRDKTGNEVFVIAARFAGRVIKWDAHNLVTGALRSVPRAVKCRENIAFVFAGKLIARVKTQIERR